MTLSERFEKLGYMINTFNRSDTNRFGPFGESYKFYASKNGMIVKQFEDKVEASDWIEAKELCHEL